MKVIHLKKSIFMIGILWVAQSSAQLVSLGQEFHNGIIVGLNASKTQILIAAKSDSPDKDWGCATFLNLKNTTLETAINQQRIALPCTSGMWSLYQDGWHVPNVAEFGMLEKAKIGMTINKPYWLSNDINPEMANFKAYGYGVAGSAKKTSVNKIRLVKWIELRVGDEFPAGIVIAFDSAKTKVLLGARADLAAKSIWGCPNTIAGQSATVTTLEQASKTKRISSGCTTGIWALTTSDGWHVPNQAEFLALAEWGHKMGMKSAPEHYWISNEANETNAWNKPYNYGTSFSQSDKANLNNVHLVKWVTLTL